ncbi:MAG: YfhO family protein [Clostridium sp.]|nr:YfhO family protein [Clostridium sp.]MCM1172249.1 YfhO family protein [Clostridium sp.]MCM1209036.1 YfhO family protein [Ruminococcus sp.]
MLEFIKNCLLNDKLRYLIAGGCTTLVNLISFFLLRVFTDIERNICNVIAICMAITFAYFANRFFVFRSRTKGIWGILREAVSFVALRMVSMAVEILGFAILCDSFRLHELVSKIFVQVIVLVLNYIFSKFFVFKKTKRTVKEFFADNFCYILSGGIVFCVMLVVVIAQKIAPFGNRSLSIVDSLHQYLPYFSEYRDKLLHEGSLFYTWNVAMGANFMSLSSYYLASPFNLIFLLFGKEGMAAGYTVIAIAKIVLCAVAMTHFLSYKDGIKSRGIHTIAISVAYALSNYVVGYYWNVMWLDCIFIFPLIMLGFIRLMEQGDPKMYALSLFYALYCNYYIGFIICIFLVIWFFAYNHKKIKKFFVDGLKFALYSLIAGGMAAFMLVPAYKGIMLTASAGKELPKWELYGSWFALLKQHLFMTMPITNQTFDGGVNLYCGMLAVVTLFMYVLSRKIKLADKIRNVAVLTLLMVSFNSVPLNFIWHGFHDQYGIPNRFSFLYIFVILVMAYDVLKRTKAIKVFQVVLSGMLAAGFVILCNYKVGVSTKIFVTSLIAVVIYSVVCLLRAANVYKGRMFHVIVTGILMVELCVNSIMGFFDNGYADYEGKYSTTSAVEAANRRIDELEEEQDAGFYRRELMDSTVLDEASWHNMKSISVFCSTVLGEMTTLMGRLGFYTGANEFLYMGATPFTNSIFNVKYLLHREGDLNNFDFDYVDTVSTVGIYENPYPLSIGFAVDDSVKNWSRNNSLPINNQNSLANAMTGYEGFFDSVVPDFVVSSDTCDISVNGNVITYTPEQSGKNGFMVSFFIEKDGDYYINCRGNYVTKIRFYINGEEYAYDRYQIQLFHLGTLSEGDYISVEYCFDSVKAEENTASIYMGDFDREAYERVYHALAEHMLSVTSFEDGYVKGTITMPENKTLFTSIPYDEGWSVYVDGAQAEYYALGGALIGIDLSPGEHEIEMIYTPQGLYIGIYISLWSWILLVAIVIAKQKKKKMKEDKKEEKTDEINMNDIDRSLNL